MKNLILLIAVLLTTSSVLLSQERYVVKESKMEIAGTSTLHDWVSNVLKVDAAGDFTVNDGQIMAINTLTVKISVKDIQSTKGSLMDNKTYDALKSDDHPLIQFGLTEVVESETTYFGQQLTARGNLEIAGKSLPVNLEVKGSVSPEGDLSFEGSKEINMVDFDMEPPKAMLGAIKAGELVTVNFSLTMKKQ